MKLNLTTVSSGSQERATAGRDDKKKRIAIKIVSGETVVSREELSIEIVELVGRDQRSCRIKEEEVPITFLEINSPLTKASSASFLLAVSALVAFAGRKRLSRLFFLLMIAVADVDVVFRLLAGMIVHGPC